MSTQRRHLVSRSRQNESATPGPSRRGRDSQAPTQQTLSLPPYEPPSCPLSAGAKRKIDELRSGRNFTKYEKHLKGSITAVSDSAAACHERLTARKENLDRQAAKRKKDGIADDEKPQDHVEADNYYRQMANKVKVATKESDKAIRELIDLSDEMRMQDSILREVEENIPDAPPARPARRQRGEDDEDEENEEPEAPAEDPEILSAIELVKKAKENYVTKYQEKSLLKRYGDSNDYRNFKRLVHSAQYPGEEKPPLPKASTWFPEENGNNPEEDSDDDVVIEGSKKSLKCVLTMRYFEEPWANNLCPHVFEKAGFLEYLNGSGASFTGANGQRGEKKVACPQPGCNKMLAESDMYLDKITIREVQRELKKNSREDYNDDDDDDADDTAAPRGTRRDPEQLGSEDDEDNSMDIDGVRQKRMAKFKREKSMGLSQAPPSHQRSEWPEPDEDEIEIMNMTQG